MTRSAVRLPPLPPLVLVLLLLVPVACDRGSAPAQPDAAPAAPATAPPPATTAGPLEDVVETTPRYIIGISYPKSAARYPGLAAALRAYAESARAELMSAVEGLGNDVPPAPYDLSLGFTELLETPELVTIAADGSTYTGGAHGAPLIARFVWLPKQQRMLTADELIPTPQGWQAVSAFVREQLLTALSQRVDADDLPPAERAGMLKSASGMVDEGTTPEAASFAQFEPVLGRDGRIVALRFVFPPYQVGPYADGVQTVDVPADVLLPHVAPAYRSLFRGGDAG
jgi:hypothetical protein